MPVDPWDFYVSQGFSVFPAQRDKKPFFTRIPKKKNEAGDLKPTWEPFQTRHASPSQIARWKSADPPSNIAIATGRLSNLTVIDADSADAVKELEGLLPPELHVPQVSTPRPNRRHFYFAYCDKLGCSSAGGQSKKIDVKSEGGYVLAPPSATADGPYEWHGQLNLETITELPQVPVPIVELLLKPRERERPLSLPEDEEDIVIKHPNRHIELRDFGIFLKHAGLSNRKIARWMRQKNLACDPPKTRLELNKIISYVIAFDTGTLGEPEEENLTDFFHLDLPERETLIHPILGIQELTMLHGRPKIGKSVLGLQLCRSLTTGEDWLGYDVVKMDRKILIIQVELSRKLFHSRVKKVFAGVSADAMNKIIIPTKTRGVFLNKKEGQDFVRKTVEKYDFGLIMFDPYIQFFPDEDAAYKNPKAFFDFCQDLINGFNLSIFFIHHDAKSLEGKIGGQKAIGTSLINSSTDGNWNIDRILGAGLDPLEFQKTARLSFESRNWSAQRPIDIRMNETIQFDLCGQIHGKLDKFEIVRMVEEAGGKIQYKDLRTRFHRDRDVAGAKREAVVSGLIKELKTGGPGNPITLILADK